MTRDPEHADGTGGHVVVGGAGFIGSHLVDRLLAEGERVVVVDDLSSGSLANLAEARATATPGHLTIHHLDAATPEFDALLAIRRPAVVSLLASMPDRRSDPRTAAAALERTLVALEACRVHGVSKVVAVIRASSVYGFPAARDLPLKERPLEPRGVPGVMARSVVDLLDVYRADHGLEFTVLALASVYGPRQRPESGVVAAFVHAAARAEPSHITGDGRQTRDFVFVDDVVDALVRAGRRGSGLVVNVGTGVQTSVRELWASIAGAGAPEPVHVAARADELQRFAVSPVRARIHLEWSPWTTLAQGLAELRER